MKAAAEQFSDPWGIFPAGREIRPLDRGALAAARARVDSQAKPRGSLGRLEEIGCRLAAMAYPCETSPARVFTVAGDHGVCAEKVSGYPQDVTRQMVANFLAGGAGINSLADAAGMALTIVDAGCCGGPFGAPVVDRRLGDGTANIAQGPAMSLDTCLQGLRNGIGLALDAVAAGDRCLAIGEMGIANTTPATALYAHLLSMSAGELAGPGTGVSSEVVAHKADVVRKALLVNARHLAGGGDGPDPVRALACLGGFEIVTMAGIVLGGACAGVPVLVDGFISSSAYAAAVLLCPAAAEYCFVSHASAEPGHVLAMEQLGRRLAHPEWNAPLLHLGMRLGEGTGCAVAWPLLRAAAEAFRRVATFEEASVSGKVL